MNEKKIIAVVGATASGKTALAVALAKKFNGEVVSCDSMQIYKNMNIGTAKPTFDEMGNIPHHMIDICEIHQNFSCADYTSMAREIIDQIISRNKVPILCGGTGLYLDSILTDRVFADMENDFEYRNKLFEIVEQYGVDFLHDELKKVDIEAANVIHKNNVKRVVRALEIYHSTGISKTEWDKKSCVITPKYDSTIIGLDYTNRENLYNRINLRVDTMIEDGLIQEIQNLVDEKKLRLGSTAYQAIGYKEIIDYLNGVCTLEKAIENLKIATRNYAKRQLTWFRRNNSVNWIYIDKDSRFKDIVNNACHLLTYRNICDIMKE